MSMMIKHDQGMRFAAQSGHYTTVIGKAEGDDDNKNSMSPGQLFIAAIGACIGVDVVRFCDRHGLPYERMTVELNDENEDSPPCVASVNATVTLPAPVPEKYRGATLRAAQQCYVTQSIEHNMAINVSLSAGV